MKKNFITLMSLTLFASIGLLSGCDEVKPNNLFTDVSKTLAVEAVSSLNLVSSRRLLKQKSTEPTFDVEKLVNRTNALFDTKIDINEVTSDKEEYSSKQEITLEANNYVLYYNIKESMEEEDGETETKKHYIGILINNEIEYNFKASEEIEEEENEFEKTLHFKLDLGNKSFISVKQEYEKENNEEEVSFKYSYVENGLQKESFKISREIENQDIEIKLKENNEEYKLSYFVKDNQEYLKVKYNKEKYLYKVILDQETNVKSYQLVEAA